MENEKKNIKYCNNNKGEEKYSRLQQEKQEQKRQTNWHLTPFTTFFSELKQPPQQCVELPRVELPRVAFPPVPPVAFPHGRDEIICKNKDINIGVPQKISILNLGVSCNYCKMDFVKVNSPSLSLQLAPSRTCWRVDMYMYMYMYMYI